MEIELLGPLVVTRDDRPLGWAGPSRGCCSRCSPSTRAEWSGSTAWSTGSGERTCRPRRHCRWGRRARLRAAPGGAGLVARGRAGRLSRRPRGARRRHPPRGAAPGGAGGSRRGRPRARPASPGDRGAPGAGRAGAPTRAPARPAHASPVRDRPTGRRARRLPARPRGPGRARRPGPRPRAAPPGSPAPRPGPGAGDRSGTVGRRASGHPPRRPGGQGAGRRPTGAWRGGGRDRTAPGATAAVVPSNLPAPLTSFVGREEEIAQVRELLGRGRLVTLVGPGGAGKTRLALEAVTRLLAGGEVGRDGAWLVELASLRDPALLPGAVLDAVSPRVELARLEAPAAAGEGGGATRRPLRALANRHLLVILDNCEHLVEAAASLVETILGACPGVRVLATSREALRLPMPALPMPPEDLDDPEELLAFDAGRLFVERARAVVPSLELAASQAQAIVEICRGSTAAGSC